MSRLIAMSSRGFFAQISVSATMLALAACSGGMGQSNDFSSTSPIGATVPPAASGPTAAPTPTPTSTSTPTPVPPNSPPASPASSPWIWAIPFTVSGLTSGASLSVVLNGTYARVITNDSPNGGTDLFVPYIPAGYPGLPNGTSYSITVGSQPAGETCTVSNGAGTLVNYPGPSAAVISCAPTPVAPPAPSYKPANTLAGAAVTRQNPTGRQGAASFADLSGNFWLFGGSGESAAGARSHYNDLWKFSPDLGGWRRVVGSDSLDDAGRYGTRGLASPSNVPGARANAISWTDSAGNLWIFGGQGRDSTGTFGALGDLWKFNVAARQWTWVSGSDVADSPGMYEVQNAPSATNRPGARSNAASWIDSSGTLWLLGGYGFGAAGPARVLDDLWQFTPSTGTWTWVSGSITAVAGME